MEISRTDRLAVRLLALNLRVCELDAEVQSARLEAARLESSLGDARLAQLLGEEAGDPPQLDQRLEELRRSLEEQCTQLDQVKGHRQNARVHYTVARASENLLRAGGPEPEPSEETEE